jgi:hypothetical protein
VEVFSMRSIMVFLAAACGLSAANYYVDSVKGADSNTGTSTDRPWKSLEKVNAAEFAPGDRALFKKGSVWQGQLAPKSSGTPGAPIVIDSYGSGGFPRIDGGGQVEDAVRLYNVQQIEVRGLEITNRGAEPVVRRGVHVFLDNFGTASHVVIAGLYIHDVNGANQNKDNGGIIFRTKGDRVPSRFDGLTIERNIVWRVDRSGVAAESYHWSRARWNPSLNVIIRDNLVDDIGGDGIVPWATDSAVVEHNVARNCNRRADSYNAGIWPWSADNTVFQLNEAAFTRTTLDGEGFDSDYNSRNTLFQYNYSHDNEGGFLLICTPGKRNPRENIGNTGTTVRYNISRNDRTRIFHLGGASEHTTIENNAIYVGPRIDVQMVITTDWDGWAGDAIVKNNRFFVEGTARYGHQAKRNPDGTYVMEPGWGPGRGIVFEGNRYAGHHVDRPQDPEGLEEKLTSAPRLSWNAPEFDPAKPDGFQTFLASHRKWMLELFEREFGRSVKLGR